MMEPSPWKKSEPSMVYELAGGRMVPGGPWFVDCNSAADEGNHEQCPTALDGTLWTPCLTCLGGGVSLDGRACVDCVGLGFWELNSLPAMVGGYTVLVDAQRLQGDGSADGGVRDGA